MRKPASVKDLVARGMAEAVEVGDCLEWQGKMGNGKVVPVVQSREGRTYSTDHSVPRALWEAKNGPIPEGMILYRKCCNNACVEMKHFAVGTRAEWVANRKKKGLTKHTAAHVAALTQGARKRAYTRNSLEKAREVRSLVGEHTYQEIAQQTGVSKAMVQDIAQGRAWKDHSNPFAGLGSIR